MKNICRNVEPECMSRARASYDTGQLVFESKSVCLLQRSSDRRGKRMDTVTLHIKPLSEDVAEMYRSHQTYHPGDSGLDLFIVEDQTVRAGDTAQIKLGIKASAWLKSADTVKQTDKTGKATKGCNVSFLVMARSSIYKTPLRLSNSVGLVDAGYRGEMMILLDNVKTSDYTIKKGERLVQAVGFTGGNISFELVEELDETVRGESGFGSTSTAAAAEGEKSEAIIVDKAAAAAGTEDHQKNRKRPPSAESENDKKESSDVFVVDGNDTTNKEDSSKCMMSDVVAEEGEEENLNSATSNKRRTMDRTTTEEEERDTAGNSDEKKPKAVNSTEAATTEVS